MAEAWFGTPARARSTRRNDRVQSDLRLNTPRCTPVPVQFDPFRRRAALSRGGTLHRATVVMRWTAFNWSNWRFGAWPAS
jgi:hypothetical protein